VSTTSTPASCNTYHRPDTDSSFPYSSPEENRGRRRARVLVVADGGVGAVEETAQLASYAFNESGVTVA
jgi:hypothetical protein